MASMQSYSEESGQCIAALCKILGTNFISDLTSATSSAPPGSNLRLRVEGRVCNAVDTQQSGYESHGKSSFLMVR